MPQIDLPMKEDGTLDLDKLMAITELGPVKNLVDGMRGSIAQLSPEAKKAKDLEAKITELEGKVAGHQAEADKNKSSQTELEKLRADLAGLNTKLEGETQARTEAETARVRAERLASLTGKVVNPEAALRLLDEAKHLKDGALDATALLAEFPFLVPADPKGPTLPGAPASGGAPQAADLEKAAASGDRSAINSAFDAALKAHRGG